MRGAKTHKSPSRLVRGKRNSLIGSKKTFYRNLAPGSKEFGINQFGVHLYGLIMLIYSVLYLWAFNWLEHRRVFEFHVVHAALDDMIPFEEVFVIPYLLWFPYIMLTVLYFTFRKGEKTGYYQLAANLIMGMTIFLIVSYVYPNMQQLRPASFERDNIFTHMVSILYRKDTPTNILPSIHVFNSIACHLAIHRSPSLRRIKPLQGFSFILMLSIILSTMFLKQHSVVDVFLGLTMALFGYVLFYSQRVPARSTVFAVAEASRGRR